MAIPSQQNYIWCESGPVALSERDGHSVPVCIYTIQVRILYFTLLYVTLRYVTLLYFTLLYFTII